MRPPVAFACRFIIWMSTGTRPRQWVAVHRKHHAHTDKEGDPHSPVIFGYSLVQFGNAVLYRRVSKNREQVVRYAKDLPEDRWDKVLFNHALLGLALGIGLLIAVFGWEIAADRSGGPRLHLPAGWRRHQRHRAQVGQAAARQPGHQQPVAGLAGRRRGAAQQPPRRHHFSSRMSMAKGEVDPGWWAIWLLVKLRWADVAAREAGRQTQPGLTLPGRLRPCASGKLVPWPSDPPSPGADETASFGPLRPDAPDDGGSARADPLRAEPGCHPRGGGGRHRTWGSWPST